MIDQIHLRIKNPETRDKINYICKTKKISFTQLINKILDDFVAQNDDKKYFKATSESLIELEKKMEVLIKLEQKNLLMNRKNLEIITKNDDEKVF